MLNKLLHIRTRTLEIHEKVSVIVTKLIKIKKYLRYDKFVAIKLL